MTLYDIDAIIAQHDIIIDEIGGAHGIRDVNLLDSAISATFQTSFGQYLYPTVYDKAAHLAYALIKNHPFIDGNKRIGITVMYSFLADNNVVLHCNNDDLINFGLSVADGTFSPEDVKTWILQHTR